MDLSLFNLPTPNRLGFGVGGPAGWDPRGDCTSACPLGEVVQPQPWWLYDMYLVIQAVTFLGCWVLLTRNQRLLVTSNFWGSKGYTYILNDAHLESDNFKKQQQQQQQNTKTVTTCYSAACNCFNNHVVNQRSFQQHGRSPTKWKKLTNGR